MKAKQMRKRAVLMELGSLGVSQKRAAALLGLHPANVSFYCHTFGIKLPREKGGFAPMTQRSRQRAEVMVALYREGYTLEQIGAQFGITRERVRQLMTKHFGVDRLAGGHHVLAVASQAKRASSRNDRYLRTYGCTWDEYVSARAVGKAMVASGVHYSRTPTGAFNSQRHNAEKRGIGWELTFWQWWTIWQQSGHWSERGRGQGYVMCRRGDVGPYAVGNVFIDKATVNSSEGRGKNRPADLPIGVKRAKSGRYSALRRINGKAFHCGTHDTPELAYAAYLMAGEQYARAA